MDASRKWNVLAKLVSADYPGVENLIAQMAAEDESALGKGYQLMLSSLRPNKEAKEAAWNRYTDEKTDLSLEDLGYLGMGIFDPNHPQLAQPFIDRYFQYLGGPGQKRDFRFLQRFVSGMFPDLGNHQTLEAANDFLQKHELNPTLKKMILEQVDELQRQMHLRDRWDKEEKSF